MLHAVVSELQPQLTGVRLVAEPSQNDDTGKNLVLVAFFDTEREGNTDMLHLEVSFENRDGNETIHALVMWGHDSLHVEAENSEENFVQVTPKSLDKILLELPRLIGAFKAAVLRGHPPLE